MITNDDHGIICKVCGYRRGAHYSSNSPVIFCNFKDIETYHHTGAIDGGQFEPVKNNIKDPNILFKRNRAK